MISQRAARPSGSVEKLRQLSLSNLRGIDETCAPTDAHSILSAINFTNNFDGSLSLRKPLLIAQDWTATAKRLRDDAVLLRVVPLYTEQDYIVLVKLQNTVAFSIYNGVEKSFIPSCGLHWHDYTGKKYESNFQSICNGVFCASLDGFADILSCNTVHSATGTILGNCTVNATSKIFEQQEGRVLHTGAIVKPNLYPDYVNEASDILVNRYIKIFKTDVHGWTLEVHVPETNVMEFSKIADAYVHPLNTLLDDMYAIQDGVGLNVPSVTQIVPYVYTTDVGNAIETTDPVVRSDGQLVVAVGNFGFNTTHESHNFKYENSGTYSKKLYHDYGVDLVFEVKMYSFGDCHISMHLRHGAVALESMYLKVQNVKVKVQGTKNGTAFNDSTSFNATLVYDWDSGDSLEPYRHLWATSFEFGDSFEGTFTVEYDIYLEFVVKRTLALQPYSISELTTSLKKTRFRGANSIPFEFKYPYLLKAFCTFPKTIEEIGNAQTNRRVYATWRYTLDGVLWKDALSPEPTENITLNSFPLGKFVKLPSEKPLESISSTLDKAEDEGEKEDNLVYETIFAVPFDEVGYTSRVHVADTVATSPEESDTRVDVLKISKEVSAEVSKTLFTNALFRFKIMLVDESDGDGTANNPYKCVATYSQKDYAPVKSREGEFWYSTFKNSSLGKKVYHNKRIFSYGDPSFETNIFVTEPGELYTPFDNVIDIAAAEDVTVSNIVPWKDYLLVSTPQALYLVSQTEYGYLTKTVNTAVGIPVRDGACAVATLNGVVFKSGSKLYLLYPNIYAGDDSVANVTVLSDPINSFLEDHLEHPNVSPFAFGTESEYVLMLPRSDGSTMCLSYNYNAKLWNCTKYPIVIQNYVVHNLTDIRVFGTNASGSFCEYHFNKTSKQAYGTDLFESIAYGDILSESENGIKSDVDNLKNAAYEHPITPVPIEFELDTGQKSDQILTKKQFVETKIVLATNSHSPAIDMNCTIHVGGNASVIVKDISTDSVFWKREAGGAVLNTSGTGLGGADAKNVLRQLVLRYSGKGNSIRHIITGRSLSNFSLYETYVRYKLLNVKQ